jgi:hypothetical protein
MVEKKARERESRARESRAREGESRKAGFVWGSFAGRSRQRARQLIFALACDVDSGGAAAAASKDKSGEMARLYLEHSSTSAEVKACLADLRVLNKGDFKALLKWRLGLRAFKQELLKAMGAAGAAGGGSGLGSDDGGDDDDGGGSEDEDDAAAGKDGSQAGRDARRWAAAADGETDDAISAALEARQGDARMKVRREKKKERAGLAKLRERKALGMAHNSFEPAVDDGVFALKSLGNSRAALDAAAKVSPSEDSRI